MARQATHTVGPTPSQKPKPRDPVASGERDAAVNRAASHNYFLLDRFEAGVALRGSEVKSIREGKANLKDAYGLLKDGEAFLLNAHIGPYSHDSSQSHDSLRTRKLLLHNTEIEKLFGQTQLKGYTLIPTRLYFRKGRSNANWPSPRANRTGTSARPRSAEKPTARRGRRLRIARASMRSKVPHPAFRRTT